jgi:hypothetical protein
MKHKESKEDRFHRLAEARVNKIIPMIRLLGNLSNTGIYSYSRHQVEQIFTALQLELVKAKIRFLQPQGKRNKRFSLSEPYDLNEMRATEDHPAFVIPLPDGTYLRAVGFPNEDYPAINIYWDNGTNAPTEILCFAEFNQEKQGDMRVCIGAYCSDEEDTTYYEPYMAERNVTDD